MADTVILALNSGSSSLKFGLFAAQGGDVRSLCAGSAEEIGGSEGRFWVRDATSEFLNDERRAIAGQDDAVRLVAKSLGALPYQRPAAIGHRIVHGGPHIREHRRITPEVMKQLEAAVTFAPLHVPIALEMIRQAEKYFPGVPQFACLDTAFHRTLTEAAARFALPQEYWDAGVMRYGFHGLSCESILHSLTGNVPARLIIAHLGSGASVTAVANGKSADTTMGLTPTGGIIMGTRTGDLDPGVLLHILHTKKLDVAVLEKLLDKESGLLGISGKTSGMRELHELGGDARAQLAVEMFCRSAKKAIGAYIALLGGLDLLVFTGGIGENDAIVRERICHGLEPLGISLDPERNMSNANTISSDASRVRVAVIPTQEEAQIARHSLRLLTQAASRQSS
jgi:acetate kinase